MTAYEPEHDRRQYPRVKAPILCRPAGSATPARSVVNIGLGGVRVYSDHRFEIGQRLEIGLYLPNYTILTFTARIVWLHLLPEEAAFKYDVGLQFLEVPPNVFQLLVDVLEPYTQPAHHANSTPTTPGPDPSSTPS
jgi:hypothetical protein